VTRQDDTRTFSASWFLWLVAAFIASLQLGWWFFWHVLIL
jgi:hypothetical protein